MNFLRQLFNPWVILGSLVIGVLLIAAAFAILARMDDPNLTAEVPTAAVTLIPAPTLTLVIPTALPQTPTATIDIPPSPLPGVLGPGAIVQITGTGGTGLNLRETPGLDSKIQYLGLETEVFTIVEGPVEKDGLVWWRLVGFSDETRSGWGASNYLTIVQTP